MKIRRTLSGIPASGPVNTSTPQKPTIIPAIRLKSIFSRPINIAIGKENIGTVAIRIAIKPAGK